MERVNIAISRLELISKESLGEELKSFSHIKNISTQPLWIITFEEDKKFKLYTIKDAINLLQKLVIDKLTELKDILPATDMQIEIIVEDDTTRMLTLHSQKLNIHTTPIEEVKSIVRDNLENIFYGENKNDLDLNIIVHFFRENKEFSSFALLLMSTILIEDLF